MHDADALARVLGDPAIGNFRVQKLVNESRNTIEEEVDGFFAERKKADFLVLYFSCHGVKNQAGRLYFAASATKLSRLASTGIDSVFVKERINESRAGKVLLLLDCCYSGAFARGLTSKAGTNVEVIEQFQGRGRAVITASDSTEYAFEGEALTDEGASPSVFTNTVVRGLDTGEADIDEDGRVSVDDLYEYVFGRIRQANPNPTPRIYKDLEGELYLAVSPRGSRRAVSTGDRIEEIMLRTLHGALEADEHGRHIISLLASDPDAGALDLARWLEIRKAEVERTPQLPGLLDTFIKAESWTQALDIVAGHPELLEEVSEEYINEQLTLARSRGDDTLLQRIEERHTLVKRCRVRARVLR